MKKSLIVAAILSLFAAASFAQAPVTHKPAHHPPSSRAPHAQARCQVRPRRIHRAGRSGTFWGLPRTSRREKCARQRQSELIRSNACRQIVVVLARQVLQRVTRDVRVTALPAYPLSGSRTERRRGWTPLTSTVEWSSTTEKANGVQTRRKSRQLETTNLTAFSGGIAPSARRTAVPVPHLPPLPH